MVTKVLHGNPLDSLTRKKSQVRVLFRPLFSYLDLKMVVSSTWVGDLEAGSSVMLLSVHPDGRACFAKGRAIQGWDIQGWVVCNRLLFYEPTPIVNPDE